MLQGRKDSAGDLGVGQMGEEQPLNSGLWVQGQVQRNKDEKVTKAGRGHVARQEHVRVERGRATTSARSDYPPPLSATQMCCTVATCADVWAQ